ncbi:glycosyltransferase family 2 protein [Neobacillus drentensis]|uniref:glycosyltransferase family 2 protein n=1 Tax=Neobacillus drentensis TaxID=220684 RepID=UPI00285747C3|nr:glycosyltransferase family 2 protein [Neobacillus drentensis]MDR7240688.1 glycosyltransferase involved in cell wall biosynthesis [Neobacillus drentensis]
MVSLNLNILKRIKNKIVNLNDSKDRHIKISVVVPTYNTDPDALKRLVNSIDKQTMSKKEYELVFIDDGSTTDIYSRLKKLAASRSNVIVKQIPNSGWGSRPRNIGTKLAKGDYILYLDHDDLVFPEAFERVYQYGIENNADAVNAKEVRTNGWSWGWDQFKSNESAAEKLGIQSLLPMTPHKFYRRQFLLDNGIEFNEGARVLWEDVYFNTKVFSCGASVAILSDYPTYYWIATGANNSSSFGRDPHEKWDQIRKLIQFFIDTIPDQKDLTFMLTHWYQSRVLGILGKWLLDKKEDRIAVEYNYARSIASELIPKSIDENLNPINKVRAYYLRNDMIEELKKLAQHEKNVTARSYASEIKWIDGKLFIEASADITVDEKEPFLFHLKGDRIFRDIPADLESTVPSELLDLTNEVNKATYEASIKGRDSRETWNVPVDFSEVKTKQINSTDITLNGRLKVYIDIQKAKMGEPLDRQPWDVAARFTAVGYTFHRGIVAEKGYGSTALVNGVTVVAYCNKSNLLSIDIGSKVRSIVGTSKSGQSDLTLVNENKGTALVLYLPNTHVYGKTTIHGEVELKSADNGSIVKSKAILIGDEKGARVEATLKVPLGKYRLSTTFEGRRSDTGLFIVDRESTPII